MASGFGDVPLDNGPFGHTVGGNATNDPFGHGRDGLPTPLPPAVQPAQPAQPAQSTAPVDDGGLDPFTLAQFDGMPADELYKVHVTPLMLGDSIQFVVHGSATVLQIKQQLEAMHPDHPPVAIQNLIYNGDNLDERDGDQLVDVCGRSTNGRSKTVIFYFATDHDRIDNMPEAPPEERRTAYAGSTSTRRRVGADGAYEVGDDGLAVMEEVVPRWELRKMNVLKQRLPLLVFAVIPLAMLTFTALVALQLDGHVNYTWGTIFMPLYTMFLPAVIILSVQAVIGWIVIGDVYGPFYRSLRPTLLQIVGLVLLNLGLILACIMFPLRMDGVFDGLWVLPMLSFVGVISGSVLLSLNLALPAVFVLISGGLVALVADSADSGIPWAVATLPWIVMEIIVALAVWCIFRGKEVEPLVVRPFYQSSILNAFVLLVAHTALVVRAEFPESPVPWLVAFIPTFILYVFTWLWEYTFVLQMRSWTPIRDDYSLLRLCARA